MNTRTRRFVRPILLLFLAMGLAACHFHGGHCGGGGYHHHYSSCAPIWVPIPWCR